MANLDFIITYLSTKILQYSDLEKIGEINFSEISFPLIIILLFLIIFIFLTKAYNEDDEKMHKTSIIALFTFAITATSMWFIMDKSITEIKIECKQKELKNPTDNSENVEKLRKMLQEMKLEKAREAQMDNQ